MLAMILDIHIIYAQFLPGYNAVELLIGNQPCTWVNLYHMTILHSGLTSSGDGPF